MVSKRKQKKEPPPLHIQAAIDFFGSIAKWADAVNVRPMTAQQWVKRKNVPPIHAVSTEIASGGVITKESLRPDLFLLPKQKAKQRAA